MTKVMNINKDEKQSTEVTDVDVNSEESKAPKTLEELKEERTALEKEVDKDATDARDALYEIDFIKESNITSMMKLIDKNLEWTIKEAALNVNLYDNLKSEKNRIKDATEDKDKSVRLGPIDLNTLYQSLTTLKGQGIQNAKSFLRLLTDVGNNISGAMNKMAANNKVIQDKHIVLGELDKAIQDLESPTEEANEIIEDKS